jgi:hypothetical protein
MLPKKTTLLLAFALCLLAVPIEAQSEIHMDTKWKIFVVTDHKLMQRRRYQKMGNPLALTLDLKNVPPEMYEAGNAAEIA